MIFLLLILNLWGQEVVIPSEKTSDLKFEKFLISKPQYKTFIEFQMAQKPPTKEQLYEELKKAQYQFIKGSLDISKKHFISIISQQHKADWDKETRNIIHYSFLRLAQLEKNQTKQNKLLRSAVVFNPQHKVDSKLFPPPLLEKYSSLLKNETIHVWPLPSHAQHFSKIIINGHPLNGQTGFIKYQKGLVRITFLSNRLLPVHFTTDMEKLETLKLPMVPLASGECQNPIFNDHVKEGVQFIFYDEGCTGVINKPIAQHNQIFTPPESTSHKKNKQFYKSKWFWVGVSVVAAGLTWHSLSQKDPGQTAPVAAAQPTQEFSNE